MTAIALDHHIVRYKGHDRALCGMEIGPDYQRGTTPCVICAAKYALAAVSHDSRTATSERIAVWKKLAGSGVGFTNHDYGQIILALIRKIEELEAVIVAADDAAQADYETRLYDDTPI